MTGIRPTAIAYVSGEAKKVLDDQCRVVADYAKAEGFALEHVVEDQLDGFTISQLVADALAWDVRVVLIPAAARMAEAQARVTRDLEPHGAVCVVIGPRHPADSQRAGRLASNPPRQRQEGAGASTPQTLDVT